MKKLTLLIVLFLTLGLTATFALDVEPSWSGDATLTWGVDLNNSSTGFEAIANGAAKLLFLDAASVSKAGEGTVYGSIEINEATIALDTAAAGATLTAPSVTAKIIMDPLWIKIYSRPGMEFDWAADAEGDGNVVEVGYTYAGADVGGLTVGVDFDPVSLEIYLASEDMWTANTVNGYAAGVKGKVAMDPITVELYALMGFNYAGDTEDIGFGASADVDLDLGGMGLKVGIDADILSPEVGALAFEIAFATDLILTYNADGDAKTQMNVDVSYSDPATLGDLDVKLGFTENKADGFIPNLTAGLTVLLYDVLGTNTMGTDIDVSGSYDIDGIKPGFAVGYDMGINSVDLDETMDLNVYLELGGLVDLTTFTLDYTSPQLLDGKTGAAITAMDKGIFTFATKVAY